MPEAAFQLISPVGREEFRPRTADLRKALMSRGLAVTELEYLGTINDEELHRVGFVVGRRLPVFTTVRIRYEGEPTPDEVFRILQGALSDIGEREISLARRSRHTDRDWTHQLQKVKRWHQRLNDVPTILKLAGRDAGLDFIDVFFESCYHLADWVTKSGHPRSAAVKRFIEDHPEMRLCRQLCNASKHFELRGTSSMRTDAQEVYINGVKQPPPAEKWVVIDDDGREWEMFELAHRCVRLWDSFLETGPS